MMYDVGISLIWDDLAWPVCDGDTFNGGKGVLEVLTNGCRIQTSIALSHIQGAMAFTGGV